MVRDIPELIGLLRRENDIVEVEAEVSTDLEIAEIHRRVIAAGGPALLFKRPKGYDIPVVTNLFGTKKRVDLTFGPRPRAFVERTVRMIHELMPPSLGKLWAHRDWIGEGLRIGTRAASGPVTQVVERGGGLDKIPMLKSWPEDGGHFVTLPLVYTEHPDTHVPNLGMYRIQRHSANTTGMHWQIGKGGGFHQQVAAARGEDLPVTVFVGGPPGLILSAVAPLPENVPEMLLASLLLGERLPLAANPIDHPHRLVATAEFALVGRVKPNEVQPEGPFGDHYGFYSLKHDYPVFHVDAVCRRKDAVWPATVVGKPRQEDLFIGDYLQELLSPLFPVVMPNVRDLWSYGETGYHALASAVVSQRFRREAMQAALRILGEGQLALTKFLWVTDQPVDLRDGRATLEHLLARFRPETDLYVLANTSMDTLDYTGPEVNLGSKGIMLGLGDPWRELPGEFRGALPGGVRDAEAFCGGCLVVSGPAYADDKDYAQRLTTAFPEWPMVVLVDDVRTARKTTRFLWSTFMRHEPAADLYAADTRIHRNHLVRSGTIVFDARHKPWYPGELFTDDDTKALVDRRWKEYFPKGGVEMGDSDAAHLDAV